MTVPDPHRQRTAAPQVMREIPALRIREAMTALRMTRTRSRPWDDLIAFSAYVNEGNYGADAVVMADIDATGGGFVPIAYLDTTDTAIPDGSAAYTGAFDGGGHTITVGISEEEQSWLGLFAGIGDGAVVRDLTVAGSVSGNYGVGALAGYIYGAEIDNVATEAQVEAAGAYAGGIAGYANGTTMTGCNVTIEASVKAAGAYAGGITGCAYETSLTGCVNRGAVTGYGYVGGLAGYAAYATIAAGGNEGDVTSNSVSTTASPGCGGLAGTISDCTIDRSYNKGDVAKGLLLSDVLDYAGIDLGAAETFWFAGSSSGYWSPDYTKSFLYGSERSLYPDAGLYCAEGGVTDAEAAAENAETAEPMLAIWDSWEDYGYGEAYDASRHSLLGAGDCFRLLYGQACCAYEGMDMAAARDIDAVYVMYGGSPGLTVNGGQDMELSIDGTDGGYTVGAEVSAADSALADVFAGALTWSSDDSGVVDVDENGRLTVNGSGATVITATATVGDLTISASITVTVTDGGEEDLEGGGSAQDPTDPTWNIVNGKVKF